MPWKVTVIFPDHHKPFVGDDLRLDRAVSTLVEFIGPDGQPASPPWRDRRPVSRDVDSHTRAIEQVGRRFPLVNRPSVPNPDQPLPPPIDIPACFAADQGGYESYNSGGGQDNNPYNEKTEQDLHKWWLNGWLRAEFGDGELDDDTSI